MVKEVVAMAVVIRNPDNKQPDAQKGNASCETTPGAEQLSEEDSEALIAAILNPPAPTVAAMKAARRFKQLYP